MKAEDANGYGVELTVTFDDYNDVKGFEINPTNPAGEVFCKLFTCAIMKGKSKIEFKTDFMILHQDLEQYLCPSECKFKFKPSTILEIEAAATSTDQFSMNLTPNSGVEFLFL